MCLSRFGALRPDVTRATQIREARLNRTRVVTRRAFIPSCIQRQTPLYAKRGIYRKLYDAFLTTTRRQDGGLDFIDAKEHYSATL